MQVHLTIGWQLRDLRVILRVIQYKVRSKLMALKIGENWFFWMKWGSGSKNKKSIITAGQTTSNNAFF